MDEHMLNIEEELTRLKDSLLEKTTNYVIKYSTSLGLTARGIEDLYSKIQYGADLFFKSFFETISQIGEFLKHDRLYIDSSSFTSVSFKASNIGIHTSDINNGRLCIRISGDTVGDYPNGLLGHSVTNVGFVLKLPIVRNVDNQGKFIKNILKNDFRPDTCGPFGDGSYSSDIVDVSVQVKQSKGHGNAPETFVYGKPSQPLADFGAKFAEAVIDNIAESTYGLNN